MKRETHRSRLSLHLIMIFTAVCLLTVIFVSRGQESRPEDGRYLLGGGLHWVSSGVWGPDGQEILMVDPVRGSLEQVSFDRKGRAVARAVSAEGKGWPTNDLHFLSIQASKTGFIAKVLLNRDAEHLLFLNQDLTAQSQGPIRLSGVERADSFNGERIRETHDWVHSKGKLFVFADLDFEIPLALGGFLEVPLSNPEAYRYVVDVRATAGDPLRSYYRRDLGLGSYFASDEDSVYFLLMDVVVFLVQIRLDEGKGATPGMFDVSGSCGGNKPQMPSAHLMASKGEILSRLDNASGIFGLYAHGGSLWVLCKGSLVAGSTFYLARLDPETGRQHGLFPIKTEAENLLLVPGASSWVFFEIQATSEVFAGNPYREIESLLVVSTEQLSRGWEDLEASVEQEEESGGARPLIDSEGLMSTVLGAVLGAFFSFGLGRLGDGRLQ